MRPYSPREHPLNNENNLCMYWCAYIVLPDVITDEMKNACVRECTFDKDDTIGWDYNHGWDFPLQSFQDLKRFKRIFSQALIK